MKKPITNPAVASPAIQIEKNIPIPVRSNLSIAMHSMDVGDSFLINLNRRSSVAAFAKAANIKVVTRGEGSMLRVWRTE